MLPFKEYFSTVHGKNDFKVLREYCRPSLRDDKLENRLEPRHSSTSATSERMVVECSIREDKTMVFNKY